MKTLTISDVRGHFPELVEEVASTHEGVIITRRGKPRACLMPYEHHDHRETRYPLRGLPITVSDDFDEPLPELWEVLSVTDHLHMHRWHHGDVPSDSNVESPRYSCRTHRLHSHREMDAT